MTRISVIYYSATGTVHRLAEAVAEGAESTGAEVRLRRVRELAPDEIVAANSAWLAHHTETREIPEATLDDLSWADDGIALGTPTRFGNPSAQIKQFIDMTGGLWSAGALTDKAATVFTAASNAHGGQESTILALELVLNDWGAIIVPLDTPTRPSSPPVAIPRHLGPGQARRDERRNARRSRVPRPAAGARRRTTRPTQGCCRRHGGCDGERMTAHVSGMGTHCFDAFICVTCGTQFAPASAPPDACPICLDERQYQAGDGHAMGRRSRPCGAITQRGSR